MLRKAPPPELGPKYKELMRDVAELSIGITTSNLSSIPTESVKSQSCEDFSICSRERKFGQLLFNSLSDGVAVLYTTEEFLEYQSHRFIFPFKGEATYHREPFFVDCQSVGSRMLNLTGAEQIAQETRAYEQLLSVQQQVSALAVDGWKNTVLDGCNVRVVSCPVH